MEAHRKKENKSINVDDTTVAAGRLPDEDIDPLVEGVVSEVALQSVTRDASESLEGNVAECGLREDE